MRQLAGQSDHSGRQGEGLWHCTIPLGAQLPVQSHDVDEMWRVQRGRGRLRRVGRGEVELLPGVCVFMPARAPFEVKSDCADDLEIVIMALPTRA